MNWWMARIPVLVLEVALCAMPAASFHFMRAALASTPRLICGATHLEYVKLSHRQRASIHKIAADGLVELAA